MPAGVVVLLNLVVGVALLLAALTHRVAPSRYGGFASAILPGVDAVVLSVFVFGEDDYRDNGISRWDAYRSPGGALGPMFVITVVLLGIFTALLVAGAFARWPRVFRATAAVAALTAGVLATATTLGFSNN